MISDLPLFLPHLTDFWNLREQKDVGNRTRFLLRCFAFASRTMEVALPDPPPEYGSLPHWLSDLIDVKLKKLLDQGDFQRVRELSLALITVLNEVGQPNLHRLKSSTGFSSFKKKNKQKNPI